MHWRSVTSNRRLLVACFVAMRSGYARKHLGAVFEELLVAMTRPPTSPNISGSRAPTSGAASTC
jgi:hypothetical protein